MYDAGICTYTFDHMHTYTMCCIYTSDTKKVTKNLCKSTKSATKNVENHMHLLNTPSGIVCIFFEG